MRHDGRPPENSQAPTTNIFDCFHAMGELMARPPCLAAVLPKDLGLQAL